jgi:hypothetical protein
MTESDDAHALAVRGVEVWKEVENSDGRYFVSNLGAMASRAKNDKPKRLRASASLSGYRTVGIVTVRYKKRTTMIHRLVVLTFVGGPPTPAHTDIRHLDGDKTHNALHNLAWGTRSENMLDVYNHRAQEKREKEPSVRVANPTYALDERLVRVGLDFHAERKLTVVDLARLWDVSIPVATGVVVGSTWSHLGRPAPVSRKHRRTPAQVAQLRAWAEERLTTAQINERLPVEEHVTPQEVYYFRGSKKRA